MLLLIPTLVSAAPYALPAVGGSPGLHLAAQGGAVLRDLDGGGAPDLGGGMHFGAEARGERVGANASYEIWRRRWTAGASWSAVRGERLQLGPTAGVVGQGQGTSAVSAFVGIGLAWRPLEPLLLDVHWPLILPLELAEQAEPLKRALVPGLAFINLPRVGVTWTLSDGAWLSVAADGASLFGAGFEVLAGRGISERVTGHVGVWGGPPKLSFGAMAGLSCSL